MQNRLRQRIRTLRAGWPRSDAPRRDPLALRFALALALIAATALNAPRFVDNLRETLRPPSWTVAARRAFLDAWVDPPAFVRKPPLVLAANGQVMHGEEMLTVHQGSRLELRFSGPTAPEVAIHALDPATGRADTLLERAEFQPLEEASWRLRLRLERPVKITLSGGVSANWRFNVRADMPPTIRLTNPPASGPGGALVVRWQATDDHGVKAAMATFSLHQPPPGMLRFDPPKARLKLLRPGKAVKGRDMLRLMAHPWAGLRVKMVLRATDVAGQAGRSRTHVLTLPSRPFSQLMARAIIEQRRELILHPRNKDAVAEVLFALLAWPGDMLRASGAYLNLRQAAVSLLRAKSEDDLKRIVKLLWTLAEDIEDGDLAAARRRLQAAREALEQALKNGASEREISRRVAELKKALNDYLNKLAQRQMQQGQPRPGHNGQVRMVRPQDLQRMLDQVERLARGGARQDAQRLLSQLDEMLQGLQSAPRMTGPPSPQERALGQMQKLMREQRKLLDETWRRAQRPQGSGGQRQDQRREGQRGAPDLQRKQRRLADALDRMREQLQRMVPQGSRPSATPEQQRGRQGRNDRGRRDGQARRGGKEKDRNGMARGGTAESRRAPGPHTQQPGGTQRRHSQRRQAGKSSERSPGQSPGEALEQAQRAMKGAARDLGRGALADALRQQRQALQALRRGARRMARQLARQQGRQRSGMAYGVMRQQYDPLGRPMRGRFMGPDPNRPIIPDENAAERARRILEYLRKRAEDATRPPLERNYIERLLKDIY